MTREQREQIAILDFGSQYTQLIARRVRESGVYCEIFPFDIESSALEAFPSRHYFIWRSRIGYTELCTTDR